MCACAFAGDWRLEVGGWRPEFGGWKLEAGLEAIPRLFQVKGFAIHLFITGERSCQVLSFTFLFLCHSERWPLIRVAQGHRHSHFYSTQKIKAPRFGEGETRKQNLGASRGFAINT